MKKKQENLIDNYFGGDNHQLNVILNKAKILKEISHRLTPHLDANHRPYCRVANLQDNKLILLVANGSIATQIRFQTNRLLTSFEKDELLSRVKGIRCKVSPGFHQETSPRLADKHQVQSVEKLSAETAELVADIADSLSEPDLKAIMKRIASHKK